MTRMYRSGLTSFEGPIVLGSQPDGTAIVPDPTPLTRLHFFDGRLLSGDDLTVEQDADRALSMLVAQSGGPGVAWGLDVDQSGEVLTVSAGLAFDPQGRPLLVPNTVQLGVADLLGIAAARRAEKGGQVDSSAFGLCALGLPVEATVDSVASATPYLLTIGWLEGYCGTMDIYGAACEQACVSGTDRPYRVDGVIFRLRPMQLNAPLPSSRSVTMSAEHLRSRLASAYFADERAAAGAISAASLASNTWCHGGAQPSGSEVPLAMVVRMGSTTVFADEWTARRERIETPARVGFDTRMAMRARAVCDAQIAQFQCELADRLRNGGLPGTSRRLVDSGIVELSPWGYLPVDQGSDVVSVVTALMGDGVDLRFLAVPADAIANEVEIVSHRDRISLLSGLDTPSAKPLVDILVPDGATTTTSATGQLFRIEASYDRAGQESRPVSFTGSARLTPRGTGFTLSAAAIAGVTSQDAARQLVSSIPSAIARTDPSAGLYRAAGGASTPVSLDALRPVLGEVSSFVAKVRAGERPAFPVGQFGRDDAKPIAARATLTVDRDPWNLGDGESAFVHLAADVMTPVPTGGSASVDLIGQLTVEGGAGTGAAGTRQMRFTGQLSTTDQSTAPQLVSIDRSATVSRDGITADGPDTYLVAGIEDLLRLIRLGSALDSIFAQFMQRGDWLRLIADPTVADPNSVARQNADVGLSLLRAARPNDPQFLERGQVATFGRAFQDISTPAMTAAHDWVAFRRRPPAAPVAAAPPHTVAVYVYPASSIQDANNEIYNIESGQSSVAWQRVATASFDATSGALTTAAQVLQSGYQATGAASGIAFIGYAPAEMQSAPSRVAAVLAALVPVAQPGTAAPQGLPTAPSGYVDPRDDGSIFLIAAPQEIATTALLQVVGFDTIADNQQAAELNKLLQTNTVHRVELNAAIPNLVKDFGTIDLVDKTPNDAQVNAVESAIKDATQFVRPVDRFPVLWLDAEWAKANPDLAKLVVALADRIAGDAAQGGHVSPQVREVAGAMGTDPTPAVLIEVYQTQIQ